MTKICTKCGEEKALELFSKDAMGQFGRKARCKACLSAYAKEWADRPGIKQRKKGWFLTHAENNPGSKLVYSARDRAKKTGLPCDLQPADIVIPVRCPILGVVLEKGSRKSHDNAPSLDRINPNLGYVPQNIAVLSDRANRIKNDGTSEEHRKIAEWILFGFTKPVESTDQPIRLRRNLINGARKRAKNIGLAFDISLPDLIIPKVCPILGIPLIAVKGQRNRSNNSPTLDRIDPSKGYVIGNIGIISYRANRLKNNGTAEEHLKIADWMDSMLQCKQLDTTYEEIPE